ncbi:MAG TPA: prenyltransferase [Ktedonobacteraceae bacterium]|nr:prenyltransferase [Ktedonobacteraceae bacterium]
MNTVYLFGRVTRARTLSVMIVPVVIGALLAWQQAGTFFWELFALTLIGALAAHLGANLLNDIFDFEQGTDQAAQDLHLSGTTIVTGSPLLLNGALSGKTYRWLAVGCFAVALLCGIILSIFRPWVLLFAILGFLLAYFYVAPPLRLAYIGRGLGEIDIFFSFGALPLVGAFYVQTGTIGSGAILVSIPVGLYTTAVLYFHHFLHWRGDKKAGKITPVVALGEHGARIVGALILAGIAFAIIILAFTQVLPWYSVVAALTVIPVQLTLRQANGELKNYVQLMASNLNNNLLAALIIVAALLVRGLTHI